MLLGTKAELAIALTFFCLPLTSLYIHMHYSLHKFEYNYAAIEWMNIIIQLIIIQFCEQLQIISRLDYKYIHA